MHSELCRKLGMEFPLFAFTHCRDVVAAVTNAGGFGVLGAVLHSPETLETELQWIDEKVNGKPYGIDLLIPNNMEDKESSVTDAELRARVPPGHLEYINEMMRQHGIDPSDLWDGDYDEGDSGNMREAGATKLLDVAFKHPIKLFVNALGVPPKSIIERARANNVMIGALTGAKEHAIKHAEAGIDILVVAGTEAGGHCGEVSTMVLIPEVLEAIQGYDGIQVLAAGGIATGKQMAACMAMGAAGAWTGSVWLTTVEAETTPSVKEKMLRATSRDTIRSRSRTGKPTRQLRSAWSDAWTAEGAPDPLPMPLQSLISRPALSKIDKLAAGGHQGAKDLSTYYVGQAVGLMNVEQTARSVVYDFMKDYGDAVERLSGTLED
jgi:NAD(P)H-dependent flavin oxidoreductase YrpB (nitropropane dioxygenase family)